MPTLEQFERQIITGHAQDAVESLIALLQSIENNWGTDAGIEHAPEPKGRHVRNPANLFTRLAAAAVALLAHPNLRITHPIHERISSLSRALHGIFAATDFGTMDHFLRSIAIQPEGPGAYDIPNNLIPLYCLAFGAESEFPLLIDKVAQHFPQLALRFAFSILSTKLCLTTAADGHRDRLLAWAPQALDNADLSVVPFNMLSQVYMGCSYALSPRKHEIKGAINRVIRRFVQSTGYVFEPSPRPRQQNGKPVMLVVIDHPFSTQHAVYRILGPTIAGARASFHVIGLVSRTMIEPRATSIFDELITITEAEGPVPAVAQRVKLLCRERGVSVLYMPSVGMGESSMLLSNTRVAPIQVTSIGHPATTLSQEMDYFILEEDYVGDPSLLSEQLLVMPRGSMPYCASSASVAPVQRQRRTAKAVVDIAIVGSLPKINVKFLNSCQRIRETCGREVHFHVFSLGAMGIYHEALQRLLRSELGDAVTVHRQQLYEDYVHALSGCDLFLSTFPFGNLNGAIDCVMAGLIGVCKDGPEVFERINAGALRRLEFPDWLTPDTTDAYERAACRLISDDRLRVELAVRHCAQGAETALYRGDPEALGRRLLALLESSDHPA